MESVIVVAVDAGIDAEEEENDRPARTESGREEHVTILMPVGFSTYIGHATGAGGATAESIVGRPAVAVDSVLLMNVANWEPNTAGDTTEVTDPEEAPADDSAESAAEAVTADLLPDVIVSDEETGEVDFGWGIVVGELSPEDFNEISSFPELVGTGWW